MKTARTIFLTGLLVASGCSTAKPSRHEGSDKPLASPQQSDTRTGTSALNAALLTNSVPTDVATATLDGVDAKTLVKYLGHSEYSVREAAERKLKELPPTDFDTLKEALRTSDDPEVQLRLRRIIGALVQPFVLTRLGSIIIPEVDFYRVNVVDCLHFLEQASAPMEAPQKNTTRSRIRFIPNFDQAAAVDLRVSLRASKISMLEALKIICNVTSMQFRIGHDAVIVEPLTQGN